MSYVREPMLDYLDACDDHIRQKVSVLRTSDLRRMRNDIRGWQEVS